jgi:hypothetical protein
VVVGIIPGLLSAALVCGGRASLVTTTPSEFSYQGARLRKPDTHHQNINK